MSMSLLKAASIKAVAGNPLAAPALAVRIYSLV